MFAILTSSEDSNLIPVKGEQTCRSGEREQVEAAGRHMQKLPGGDSSDVPIRRCP